jgi:hypothetical protein
LKEYNDNMNAFTERLSELVEDEVRENLKQGHARLTDRQVQSLVDSRLEELAEKIFDQQKRRKRQ